MCRFYISALSPRVCAAVGATHLVNSARTTSLWKMALLLRFSMGSSSPNPDLQRCMLALLSCGRGLQQATLGAEVEGTQAAKDRCWQTARGAHRGSSAAAIAARLLGNREATFPFRGVTGVGRNRQLLSTVPEVMQLCPRAMSVAEEEVGITEYTTDGPGFTGILKHRCEMPLHGAATQFQSIQAIFKPAPIRCCSRQATGGLLAAHLMQRTFTAVFVTSRSTRWIWRAM